MPESQTGRFFRNTSWMAISQAVRSIETIIRSIIIARTLGQINYSVYVVILGFVATTQEFFNLNLGAAVIKYGTEYRESENQHRLAPLITASYYVTVTSAVASVIAISFLVYLMYETFFHVSNLETYIIGFAAAASGIMIDGNNKAVLRLFEKFRLSCQIDVVVSFAAIAAFSICYLLIEMNITRFMWLAISYALVSAIVSTLVTWWELRHIEQKLWTNNLSDVFIEIKTISTLTTLNSLSLTIQRLMRKGDVLLLQVLSSPHAVAVYDVAKKITSGILLLRGPLALSAFPQISKLIANKDFSQLRDLLSGTYKYLLPITAIGLVAVALIGGDIVVICYGPEYEGSETTLFFLSAVSCLYVLFFWGNSFVLSLGRYRLQFLSHLLGLWFAALGGLLLVPTWGAEGMAISSLVGVFVIYSIYSILATKVLRPGAIL